LETKERGEGIDISELSLLLLNVGNHGMR
jgi:hypothetical protein